MAFPSTNVAAEKLFTTTGETAFSAVSADMCLIVDIFVSFTLGVYVTFYITTLKKIHL